jgi:hypothetical protein
MNDNKRFQRDALEVIDIKTILGCGINQAYKLANSGAFHVVKVGNKIKVPRESFYGWYHGQGQK